MTIRYAPSQAILYVGGERVGAGHVELHDAAQEHPEPSGFTLTRSDASFEVTTTLNTPWSDLLAGLGPLVHVEPEVTVDGDPHGFLESSSLDAERLTLEVRGYTPAEVARAPVLTPGMLARLLESHELTVESIEDIERNPGFAAALAAGPDVARAWADQKASAVGWREALDRRMAKREARRREVRAVLAAQAHQGPTAEQRRKARRQAQRAARRRQR